MYVKDTLTGIENDIVATENRETHIILVLAWVSWPHDEDLRTTQLRILATITNTNISSTPPSDVYGNTTHIFITWIVNFASFGREQLTFDVSYDNDHQFITKPDGKRRREKKSLRTFDYSIQVLEDACKPEVEIINFDSKQVWKHK